MRHTLSVLLALVLSGSAGATVYEVGDGMAYPTIGSVPWESLAAGDTVRIHWRAAPYREKFLIAVQGTAQAPVVVEGVPGPGGALPVLEADGATTRLALDYWSEERGIVKIGGSNVPPDTMPRFIVLRNLELRGARPPATFVDEGGVVRSYTDNAAAVYVEKGENVTVENCILADCGNGAFLASSDLEVSRDFTLRGCSLHDNGNPGSAFEHNAYLAGIAVMVEGNRFGPPLPGSIGNNLKDRSAGLVVRYNWIEGGNRQLDLVDAEDSVQIRTDPSYPTTLVYGNVLLELEGDGNSQMVHYGGDSGQTAQYRKGTLYLYHNTFVSSRTGNTTLLRLSTNSETCDARNNVVALVAAPGNRLALLDSTGVLDLSANWLPAGWVDSHGNLQGVIHDDGTSLEGTDPGFLHVAGGDFHLALDAPCVNAATTLHPAVPPEHAVTRQYRVHQSTESRPVQGAAADIGAFEQPCAGDLALDADPEAVAAGELLSLDVCAGQPGGAGLLAVVDGNGTPLFLRLLSFALDGQGEFHLSVTAPPGLAGLALTFQAFGTGQSGALVATNPAFVQFQ